MKNKTMVVIVTCLVLSFAIYLMSYSGVVTNSGVENEKERLLAQLHKNETVEGDFIDDDGRIIFSPQNSYNKDNTAVPVSYSYLLGYNSVIYGSSGLRDTYKEHLYEDYGTGKGGTIQLTTINTLQNAVYEELKSREIDGSIVVLENKTGKILACASRKKYDYDAAKIDVNYEKYSDIEGFFLPAATTDQDPPGSVFKIITTAAAIETQNDNFEYTENGEYVVEDAKIHNYGNYVYGNETLSTAFKNSTNTYFAALAVEKIGEGTLREVSERFYIGTPIELDFATLKSNLEFDGRDKTLAFTSFGQGKLQTTPMHIAIIGQTISNDGMMLKPYIVSKKINAKGKVVYTGKTEKLIASLDKKTARKVKEIANNTAKEKYPELCEKYPGICVKTGTAQLGTGLNHSYFLCFDEKHTILVSVNNTTQAGGSYSKIIESILQELS